MAEIIIRCIIGFLAVIGALAVIGSVLVVAMICIYEHHEKKEARKREMQEMPSEAERSGEH